MPINRLESCNDSRAAIRRTMWRRPPRLSVERSETIGIMHVEPQIGDVLDASGDPGDAFVIERAPLPAIRDGVGERTHFVGAQALQVLAFAEKHSHVRAEEFVSR